MAKTFPLMFAAPFLFGNSPALWQIKPMTRQSSKSVIGTKAFAAITAVEGLTLSAASKTRLANLKANCLNNDERRAEIIRAYRAAR
jgi:hypothetical protein